MVAGVVALAGEDGQELCAGAEAGAGLAGGLPLRCLVDFQALGLEHVLNIERQLTTEVFTKMGMERLLTASATSSAVGP